MEHFTQMALSRLRLQMGIVPLLVGFVYTILKQKYALQNGIREELCMNENRQVTIRNYAIEPPVLDQCQNCVHATITRFEPQDCPEIVAMRTLDMSCLQDYDVFAEGICNSFRAGAPHNASSLPIFASA